MSYSLPFRRTRDVSVQLLGDEVLVYDELRHKAFCLNAVSGWTWRLSDGRRTAAQIADAVSSELKHGVSEEIVLYALGELQRDGLLDFGPIAPVASRRDLVKKLGFGAALMMPVVTAVFAPTAADAYTGHCILPNTPVKLADGSEIPAGRVSAGMLIRGVNADDGSFHAAPVRSVHRFGTEELLTFATATGEFVQATASHLFIAGPGDLSGTRAATFRVGDSFLVAQDTGARASVITSVERSRVRHEVVSFQVDNGHDTFVSGGVVSHVKYYSPANAGAGDEEEPNFGEPVEGRGSGGGDDPKPSAPPGNPDLFRQ